MSVEVWLCQYRSGYVKGWVADGGVDMPVGGGGIPGLAVGMVNARVRAGYARECKVRGQKVLPPHGAWIIQAKSWCLIIQIYWTLQIDATISKHCQWLLLTP